MKRPRSEADKLTVTLVTIVPERDTPRTLANYPTYVLRSTNRRPNGYATGN